MADEFCIFNKGIFPMYEATKLYFLQYFFKKLARELTRIFANFNFIDFISENSR